MIGLLVALAAAVPVELPVQARVVDATGAPLDGAHALSFALVRGVDEVWASPPQALTLADGYLATTVAVEPALLGPDLDLVIREGGVERGRTALPTAPRAVVGEPAGRHPALALVGHTPVLHLSFDEGAGELAFDRSGTRSHATLGYGPADPPAWIPDGRVGGALRFDGSADCARVPHGTANAFLNGYTLMGWVRRAPSGGGIVVAKHYTHNNRSWDLSVEADGRVVVGLYRPDNVGWALFSTATVPATGWHHVAGTYDPATGRLEAWIDGASAGSQVIGAQTLMATSLSVTIGCYHASSSDSSYRGFFPGDLDELAILPYPLTAAELAAYVAAAP